MNLISLWKSFVVLVVFAGFAAVVSLKALAQSDSIYVVAAEENWVVDSVGRIFDGRTPSTRWVAVTRVPEPGTPADITVGGYFQDANGDGPATFSVVVNDGRVFQCVRAWDSGIASFQWSALGNVLEGTVDINPTAWSRLKNSYR